MVKKWKEYEWGVVKILWEETGHFTLRYNVNITGKSGQTRQIDLLVFKVIPEDLVYKMYDWRSCEFEIIDCKERVNPTDINDVEQFIGLVADSGAKKGTVVSSSGFTAGARCRVRIEENIGLREITREEADRALSNEIYPSYIVETCGECVDQKSVSNLYGHILWYGKWSKIIDGIVNFFWVGKCLKCERMHLHCEPCGGNYCMKDNRVICPSCHIYYTSFNRISGTDEKPGRTKYKPKIKNKHKNRKEEIRKNESLFQFF